MSSADVVERKDRFPREVLLRYRWTEGLDLAALEIHYVSRGAPADIAVARGSEITDIGRAYLSLGDTAIPYHRIVLIRSGEEFLFERVPARSGGVRDTGPHSG